VVVKGDEEAVLDAAGDDIGVKESFRTGHTKGEEGKGNPPSSIEGELEILSSMSSSSMSSSASASCMSSSSSCASPFWRGFCPFVLVITVRSSSDPGSSLNELPALFQACCSRASSAERSSSTDFSEACWCGAAGPMPSGAGCSGWWEWSWAVGDDLSCRSIVSAPGRQYARVQALATCRIGHRCRTCSNYLWARHARSGAAVQPGVVAAVVVEGPPRGWGCGATQRNQCE
jgi:hypothetical protein